jgi:hypothetical protein
MLTKDWYFLATKDKQVPRTDEVPPSTGGAVYLDTEDVVSAAEGAAGVFG